jgi:DNA gyrase subunit B/topoisomerase-4 subunit B
MKTKSTESSSGTYTAKDIAVLEGLEAVRKRPAMYIGGVHKAGLHHLLWEILDNSIDEVINGFANEITVRLHSDGQTVSVEDNGRGIPVDIHPQYKKPALELILCTLHSGGKFDGVSYAHAGGLHGVGISVVNALSEYLAVEVRRDGGIHRQEYARGIPMGAMITTPRRLRTSGTSVTFRADPDIFRAITEFDAVQIRERLEIGAYLNRGLRIVFRDEVAGREEEFHRQGGLEDYLKHILHERAKNTAHEGLFIYQGNGELRMEIALCWTEATDEHLRSFVNNIPTRSGGTHENGLRGGIVKAIRNYITTHKLQTKAIQLSAEDIREGIVGLLSIYVLEPQFQGQTKERLNNAEIQPIIEQSVRTSLEQWLNENTTTAKAIVERIAMAAKARAASRAASQVVRRQSPTRRLSLPGKLADCANADPSRSELFIVEGDSAGGSAKMGRDRKTQAILPLRGKVLNTETASLKKVLSNKELKDIVQALGCGIDKQFNINNLRYHKIILLMDADADGHHISTLLLTFFYRHLPELIQGGYVYIAQPPLYRIAIRKEIHWVLSDEDKDRIIAQAPINTNIDIQRFKGLGEMMPQILRETTLDPAKRTLLRVNIDDPLHTDQVMSELLGRDANARFRFIMERAHEVDEIDINA